ncbi:MAG: NAD(P)H-dependent oxidoreductase subunit E [Syntrophorhabdaceae bacterium]|nr:NAD(P)H-dependent oxidoreductase subunit E [Syntrophorhabdaceae bacterium]
MKQGTAQITAGICNRYENDRTRLMDIAIAVQERFGCVSYEAMEEIARAVGTQRVEVESLVTFYSFLSVKPQGKVVIRLCSDIVDWMKGYGAVAEAMARELGITMGETTPDGAITLTNTPCIGMSDQAPAALVNSVVVTHLTPERGRQLVRDLRKHLDPQQLVTMVGNGNNEHPLVRSMVRNNIRMRGPVHFAPFEPGTALQKAFELSPSDVIREIKESRLRGRGGAGFPTGLKWELAASTPGKKRYVICNADEGEPGTFKDRALLTECAEQLLEGMTIAGYAVGSDTGIIYLRGEYRYLLPYLQSVIEGRLKNGLLGKNILGYKGFNFDIRIQLGAGAYICGEETALISSCEGLRGEPKNRPPFPPQKGYLGCPTIVNNVETLCCVSRILIEGAKWFASIGSKNTTGTKVLSISGDCRKPGVYEVPFGITAGELIELSETENVGSLLIGGPGRQMIGSLRLDGQICYDDLATGGAIIIFNGARNKLEIAEHYLDFFIEENCGHCTPCRVGLTLLKNLVHKVIEGAGEPADLDRMRDMSNFIINMSRCGLGQAAPNPVLGALAIFGDASSGFVAERKPGLLPEFDLSKVVIDAELRVGRQSKYV